MSSSAVAGDHRVGRFRLCEQRVEVDVFVRGVLELGGGRRQVLRHRLYLSFASSAGRSF
jgi:hypothetical protein